MLCLASRAAVSRMEEELVLWVTPCEREMSENDPATLPMGAARGLAIPVPKHFADVFCSLCVPQAPVLSVWRYLPKTLLTQWPLRNSETKFLLLSRLWIELHIHLKWKPAHLPKWQKTKLESQRAYLPCQVVLIIIAGLVNYKYLPIRWGKVVL